MANLYFGIELTTVIAIIGSLPFFVKMFWFMQGYNNVIQTGWVSGLIVFLVSYTLPNIAVVFSSPEYASGFVRGLAALLVFFGWGLVFIPTPSRIKNNLVLLLDVMWFCTILNIWIVVL